MTADNPTTNTQAKSKTKRTGRPTSGSVFRSWRPQLHRRLGKILGGLLVVALVAAAAGFTGARLAGAGSHDTLPEQQRVITKQGELFHSIAAKVSPSVVSINVVTMQTTDTFFGPQSTNEQAAGTGIIVSEDGIIMTNRHVVPVGTTKVTVTLADGTVFDNAKVLSRTSASDSLDVAFIKIQNLKGKQLVPAQLGGSSTAKVGDSVLAIGNALGQFQNTVTAGIISGFGRQIQASDSGGGFGQSAETEDLGNLLQTDAAINPGNSGGPLVNMGGQVIGMNTAVAGDAQGIGFAIPINDLKSLITQVRLTGTFARPFLGVRYIPLTPAVAKQYALAVDHGAYIAPSGITGQDPVVGGSPADKAGLQPGDIITKVDSQALGATSSLTTAINKYKPGDVVTLTVLRDGKTLSLSATLGKDASAS